METAYKTRQTQYLSIGGGFTLTRQGGQVISISRGNVFQTKRYGDSGSLDPNYHGIWERADRVFPKARRLFHSKRLARLASRPEIFDTVPPELLEVLNSNPIGSRGYNRAFDQIPVAILDRYLDEKPYCILYFL